MNVGTDVEPGKLADMMLQLQQQGCHNVNFVTPTHVVPQILEALLVAVKGGLSIPLVYNTGGYDNVDTLKLLEGVFDIYMPDFKFWDSKWAKRYCDAPDYKERAVEAVCEMHRQVGDLDSDERDIATKGLLVRHLVMPGGAAGTSDVMTFLAEKISKDTYVNVMAQYRPCGKAFEDDVAAVPVDAGTFRSAVSDARAAGIKRLDG